jgi:hypothetical protein
MKALFSLAALLLLALGGIAQQRVNEGAALDADFLKRVAEYVKLRKPLEDGLPPANADKGKEATVRQQELAKRIRTARQGAHRGDIFSPEIAARFRTLIVLAMQGGNAARIRESLKSTEPPDAAALLSVNAQFPDRLPMPSTPPTILLNLPRLTDDVDYRIVGRSLVLHDMKAGIIIDVIPDAVPVTK